MSRAAFVVAVLLFALAGLGVALGPLAAVELAYFGAATFALAHVLP